MIVDPLLAASLTAIGSPAVALHCVYPGHVGDVDVLLSVTDARQRPSRTVCIIHSDNMPSLRWPRS
jgi:hypothetical protein